ncbi:hypothetical protein ACUTRI_17460 [Serratia sp. TSA_130.2]|uniref:hypothetical protein n=1 Tax=Serratia TaxID=613 RepID=UPI000627F8F3|nr:hypothetical protein [Serratia ureilytica]MBH3267189.1 hypothetical protein [Serratia ureilytica]PKR40905.1 hypothetical protein CU560_24770 [Serratia ureilytica]
MFLFEEMFSLSAALSLVIPPLLCIMTDKIRMLGGKKRHVMPGSAVADALVADVCGESYDANQEMFCFIC